MAEDLIALQLKMSADIAGFRKSMDAMRATADRRLNEVEKRALTADRRLSRTMDNAGRNMTAALRNSLAGIAPVIAGAFSAAAVLKYADAYTALQNRLKAAGLEGVALKRVEDSLYASANRNGVAVEATAELYQRAAMARNNLGASEEQLLALVSGTSAALKLQGTSAGEASGALLQLGQILGGEKVQAQEYNSLIDQLPVLLQAAASGSDKFGGQIAVLTQKVKAGEVTTQEFFAALLKGLAEVETKAASATPTVGAAFQTLNNEIGKYIGQTDSGLSATQRMAQAIVFLSEHLDTVTLIVAAFAAIVGTRYVLSMTAAVGANVAATVSSVRYQLALASLAARQAGVTTATVIATGATRAFSAALLANPLGAVLVAVTALAAGIYFLGQRYGEANILQREIDTTATAAKTALANYEDAAKKAAVATGANAAAARENVAAMRVEAVTALQNAQALRVRTAALAAQRAEQARKEAADIRSSVGPGQTTLNQGQYAAAQAAAVRAQAQADQAAREVTTAQTGLAQIDANIRDNTYKPPVIPRSSDDKKSSGSSGPTAEELARQQQMLTIQGEVELLRAQGREAEADARQDALDVLNLTKQFEDAGFQNARAKAEEQVASVSLAEREAKAREKAKELVEGEQRALALTRDFTLSMLDAQEQLALTDSDALKVRLQILAVRQQERRVALEQAAIDTEATEAERQAARAALERLPALERGETRNLQGSSEGARDARGIVNQLQAPDNAVKRAAEAYAEIDRLRQEDVINEQEAARAKAAIDNDLRASKLSATQEMLGNLATLQNSSNKKMAALGKAAAIAQATIDGTLAVQNALATGGPFPLNIASAAIIAGMTAANIASIAGMAEGGIVQGAGGPREDNQLRRLSVGEFVNNAASVRKNRPFLEAANNGADLNTLIPALARGGLVGRAAAASGAVTAARSVSSSSVTFAPTIDARGADMGTARHIERTMADLERRLPGIIKGVTTRRDYYRLGRNSE